MKSLAQAISNIDLTRNNEPCKPASGASLNNEAMAVVNDVFKELTAIFPAWRTAFKDKDQFLQTKKTWSKAFMENGICTIPQIRIGLKKARSAGGAFLPSCGQFIEWCQPTPEDFGLPDVQAAYREACSNGRFKDKPWSHPGVYVAGRETGFFELSSRPERETFPQFKRNYEIVTRRVMAGEDLEVAIPKALPARATSIPTETPKAKANIAAIREMLRGAA